MLSRYFLVSSVLLLVTAADTETCETCDGEASRSKSLLSLKAEVAQKSVQTAEMADLAAELLGDGGRMDLFGEAGNASNQSNWTRVNQSLHNLVTNVMAADANQTNRIPNPEGNYSDPQNRTGMGNLAQSLEFLYLKVAELETAVELQSIEFRMARIDLHAAQTEIQTLKDRLDQKAAALQQLKAQQKHHAALAQHGHKELEMEEPQLGRKHREAFAAKAKEMHQEHQRKMKAKTPEVLKDIMLKHHRQHRKDWTAEKQAPKGPKESLVESLVQRSRSRGGSGQQELDSAVSAKVVDDVGGAFEDAGNAIADTATDVGNAVTDGTGLIGDALTDAYTQAADKVAFVANTVINTVEQAVSILINGFDFSAGCPHWVWPSLAVSDESISINFGRQNCGVTLVGQHLTLFDFNWGVLTVAYPAPIAAMVAMGRNLVNCMTSGAGAFDIFKCVAKTIGETLLQVVPPFSILTQLSSMLSEFLAFFAEMASAAITGAIGETTSMVQEAASLSQFPAKGDAPRLVSSRRGLVSHVRRQETSRKVIHNKRSSLAQTKAERTAAKAKEEPDTVVGEGAIGFGTTEAMPYASMLITQFGGDEYDSASCLAFAPAHRTGANGGVTMRDWQVPSPDSPDFVKLEPWGVPCDNQWAKDNPGKWEGYSFYTYESVIEKCVAISYSMSAQPVLAFVGGLEFDLMPAPLMEVTTEVCWPDRVSAPDLSLIVTTMRTAGIVLFKHTIRLHKRFGSNTNFENGNIKDAVERARNYFGKGQATDDDKALQGMSRSVLAQLNASTAAGAAGASASKPDTDDEFSFEPESEELYLASARYDKTGVRITSNLTGHDAVEPVRAALGALQAEEVEEAEDEAEEEDSTQGLGNHELFELGSPSGALVGFSVKGLLGSGIMKIKVQMKFGPLDSPTKTIDLVNLVDQLRVILSAIPFVSQASKQKAIDAMSSTHLEAQIPVTEVSQALNIGSGWSDYGHAYEGATVRLRDGMCSVQALVAGAAWNQRVATLPSVCRPDGRLIFTASNDDNPARVDVLPDGEVKWMEGSTAHSWISLSNIAFAPGSGGWPLTLENGWVNYGAGYSPAVYKLKGSLCVLSGLIANGAWTTFTTLPEECRPKGGALIFSASNGANDVRINVAPSGLVQYGGGHTGSAWQTLTGIIFSTDVDQQQSLPLGTGWAAYGSGWSPPSWAVVEGMCVLEGLIAGSTWNAPLAYLPVDCWPMRKLIMVANGHAQSLRVDVDTEGVVWHVAGTASDSWVSLSGIAFAQSPGGTRLLPVRNSWVTYGSIFGQATFTVRNGMCSLAALVKDGSWSGSFAQLPPNCRPTKRLIFSANNNEAQARVDVDTDGTVQYFGGAASHGWMSLSNIVFAPDSLGHISLPLAGSWVAYGGDFGSPDYTVRNGVCSVEGLLSGGAWGHLATLPADCRPSERLIFTANNHESPSRVDVLPDGQITWVAGASGHGWISLSGIVFAMGKGYALPLASGWSNYGSGYSPATYKQMDGLCYVEGLVAGPAGTWGNVATLPAECHPKKTLIFNLNREGSIARVNVETDGKIRWIAGAGISWLSLTGIFFDPTAA